MALFRPRRHGEHRGRFDSATEARRRQRWLCFGHGDTECTEVVLFGHGGTESTESVRPARTVERLAGHGLQPSIVPVCLRQVPGVLPHTSAADWAQFQLHNLSRLQRTLATVVVATSVQAVPKRVSCDHDGTARGGGQARLPRASSAPWSAGSPLPGVGTVVAAVEPSSAVRARLKTPGNSRAVIGKMPGRSAGEHRANGRVHATEIAHQLALPCPPGLRGRNKTPLGARCASVATQDGLRVLRASVAETRPPRCALCLRGHPRRAPCPPCLRGRNKNPPRCALCLRGHPRRAPCPPCLRGHLRVSGAPRTRAD